MTKAAFWQAWVCCLPLGNIHQQRICRPSIKHVSNMSSFIIVFFLPYQRCEIFSSCNDRNINQGRPSPLEAWRQISRVHGISPLSPPSLPPSPTPTFPPLNGVRGIMSTVNLLKSYIVLGEFQNISEAACTPKLWSIQHNIINLNKQQHHSHVYQ